MIFGERHRTGGYVKWHDCWTRQLAEDLCLYCILNSATPSFYIKMRPQ